MIEGSLRNVPLADVFQVVTLGRKSGLLTVEREDRRGRVYFELGRIQVAHVTPGVHLGEVLVRMDLLTAYEVQEILIRQDAENAGTPLALQAIAAGLLEEEELRDALERQTLEVLLELLTWRSGSFSFSEVAGDQSQTPTGHSLDTMALLMRADGYLQEFREGSVEPSAVLRRIGDPSKASLPADAWELLAYVDGRRSARAVASEVDLPEMRAYRILFELEQAGVLSALPIAEEEPLVLVLTPSEALGRLVRLALQRARFRSQVAQGAADAWRILGEEHPRALVLDEAEAGAWDLVRELRRLPGQAHLPVVMLTGEAPAGGVLARMRRPKAQSLAKPFHEIEFQQLLGRLLGRPLT